MRNLYKLPKPEMLIINEANWLANHLADPDNETKRSRYREKSIKKILKDETHNKCVYCESKIGHNTPGDIEHKIPTSKDNSKRFDWNNLTIACSECNRRKNDYYKIGMEFLDPYTDDVESILEHYGPIVFWQTGNARAEISLKTLELNNTSRFELISQKLSKLNELAHIIERFNNETNVTLKQLLKEQLKQMTDVSSEYSAMTHSFLKTKGVL
jgi:HNH endonuclease